MSGPVFCAISNCENIQREKHAGDYPACEAEITSKEGKMERILKKRFLMILMSLMLVAGFVPMTASAEPGEKAESVTVGDVELNAQSKFATIDDDGILTITGASEENYDAMFSNGTLYLRNLTNEAPNEFHGISADGDITIDISGDNSVTGGGDPQPLVAENYGIYATGDITITSTNSGGGSLTATGGGGSNSGGIYSSGGDVTIEGNVGEITAIGEAAASSSVGIGTESGNVIIYGGTVNAQGGSVTGEAGESDGICASDGGSGNTEVGNVYINGGDVDAFGGNATGDNGHSDGICAENDISIRTTGEVSATGGTAAGHSNGICSNNGSITINANVIANGGKSEAGSIATSIAINVNEENDIIIEGGKVYAIGEEARDISAGINARSVMIKGGALFAASVGEQQPTASLGINGNVVVQPAEGKMIAVETGSGFKSDGIGPNITIYDKVALEGSPFTVESIIGGEEIAKAKVVNIYTEDAPDVTPGTDDPVSGDQTGNNGSDAKSGGTPETGDDFNAVPMVTLMALAAAVAAGTVAYGVRRKNGVR